MSAESPRSSPRKKASSSSLAQDVRRQYGARPGTIRVRQTAMNAYDNWAKQKGQFLFETLKTRTEQEVLEELLKFLMDETTNAGPRTRNNYVTQLMTEMDERKYFPSFSIEQWQKTSGLQEHRRDFMLAKASYMKRQDTRTKSAAQLTLTQLFTILRHPNTAPRTSRSLIARFAVVFGATQGTRLGCLTGIDMTQVKGPLFDDDVEAQYYFFDGVQTKTEEYENFYVWENKEEPLLCAFSLLKRYIEIRDSWLSTYQGKPPKNRLFLKPAPNQSNPFQLNNQVIGADTFSKYAADLVKSVPEFKDYRGDLGEKISGHSFRHTHNQIRLDQGTTADEIGATTNQNAQTIRKNYLTKTHKNTFNASRLQPKSQTSAVNMGQLQASSSSNSSSQTTSSSSGINTAKEEPTKKRKRARKRSSSSKRQKRRYEQNEQQSNSYTETNTSTTQYFCNIQ